ncbi:hypothetical protein SPWS13_3247 [Shewanella putrefaciens]|nr:hypothetical protein SPWS13_3247 [Shewanella putrefaciens]
MSQNKSLFIKHHRLQGEHGFANKKIPTAKGGAVGSLQGWICDALLRRIFSLMSGHEH